ncbi:hypothetical protein B0T22DRAFT_440995 [Podospora appendiculata]|uniref:Uncharacterized protein n=1 Tax=Podospora appendiculata TaxID=314037 RepID=A0AAE0XBH0_9PEZI|nr:hypothetical protein B0T22DRAFT_440995 [Podospora appendiculata]
MRLGHHWTALLDFFIFCHVAIAATTFPLEITTRQQDPKGSAAARASDKVRSRLQLPTDVPHFVRQTETEKKIVIAGKGLVLVPIGPTGERVSTDGDEPRLLTIGATTFQVLGDDVMVNGEPLKAGARVNNEGVVENMKAAGART